jgi:uncharacterized protein YoxC
MTSLERNKIKLEKTADKATKWIGSTNSLVVHTVLFIGAFASAFLGLGLDRVLLVLTTIVSLEAIYLSIFIQMSVNKNTKDIEIIQEDVEEIQEDVEGIEKDVDEIQKDVDEIQEDVEGIEKDVDEIQEDIEEIEEDSTEDQKIEQKEAQAITAIQTILSQLQREIEQLKK